MNSRLDQVKTMSSKRFQKIKDQVDQTKVYDLKQGLELVKKNASAKFDESIDLLIRLGQTKQKEQIRIRGNVELPHFQAKDKKIVAFVDDEDKKTVEAAKKAGAKEVGGENLIEKIAKKKKIDADVVVAVPKMMPKIAKVAKILGPKGLMPNPKAGTIGPDIKELVEKYKKGNQVEFKNDDYGNIHMVVGKVSQKVAELEKNIKAIIEAISKVKPQDWKGQYIDKISISSTMGVSVKLKV